VTPSEKPSIEPSFDPTQLPPTPILDDFEYGIVSFLLRNGKRYRRDLRIIALTRAIVLALFLVLLHFLTAKPITYAPSDFVKERIWWIGGFLVYVLFEGAHYFLTLKED
jgi:hypothetical protein